MKYEICKLVETLIDNREANVSATAILVEFVECGGCAPPIIFLSSLTFRKNPIERGPADDFGLGRPVKNEGGACE